MNLYQIEVFNTSYDSFERTTTNVHSSLDFHTIRSTLIIGITILTTLVSFKPKDIFWISLVDSTAVRFTTNAVCLLFVDSIRGLAKFSSITVSQFLQYNTSFTHNPFLSVTEALIHFLK